MASCYVITDSNVLLKTCKSRVKKKSSQKRLKSNEKIFSVKIFQNQFCGMLNEIMTA